MAWVETVFEEPEVTKFARLELVGDAVEGVFCGTEERKNNFGKNEVHVKIKTGETDAGEALIESLRANQRLLAQVASVQRGERVRIEYVADKPNDAVDREGKPLKPTKLYKVQVDNGATTQSRDNDDIPF